MADVFVSYSREDQTRAAEIVRLLEDSGWDVFWDQELRAGTLWPKVLEKELKQATCLVALWTETSILSDWVRIESYEALKHKKLLPILLDNVEPPLEFRQTQTLDLIGWSGLRDDPRVHRLLDDLRELTGAPHAETNGHGRSPRTLVPTIRRDVSHSETPKTLTPAAAVTTLPLAPQLEQAIDHENAARPARAESRAPDPEPKPHTRIWLWGIGAAAAVITASWVVPRMTERPTEIIVAPAPPPPSAIVAPAPTVFPPPAPIVAPRPATAEVVAPKPAAAVKPVTRPTVARCLAITEKFQQTGQLNAAEREFLRSKECQS